MPTTHVISKSQSLATMVSAIIGTKTPLLGLIVKVQQNQVIDWIFADVDMVKSIAIARGSVVFPDDPSHTATTLGQLVRSLTDDTSILALVLRLKNTGEKIAAWEFVDIRHLQALTQAEAV